ncbi:MAG TPA: hypothetical protein VGQ21_16595 [Thermoanaerobaculia bacterium]|nr:hypothetical protein [Thermoanaerobaculia bacterium]
MLCAPPVLHGVAYGGETLPGEWVRFLVIADPPPTNTTYTYQWYRGSDRQPILDATMPTLDAFTNTFETYYCVVSTTCTDGSTVSTTSTPGYLWQRSVCDFPGVQISQSVNDVSDAPNNLVVFTAYDDWPGVTFQWYRGETGDTRITMTSDAGAPNRLTVSRPDQRPYPYWVRASIPCGAYHDSATVTFSKNGCTPILFADQPVSGTVAPGQSFTLFAAMPSVNPPVATYDWYQLGAGTPILLDSHSSSYVSSGITESTRYMVRVSNNCSSNEPAGTVDSRIATMRVECPLITGIHWPAGSADRKTGETATLQVTVDPPTSGTLTYSWYKGETGDKSIPVGNNTATLVTEPLSASATYWVWISNGLCNSDSPTIHVTLCVPPQIVPNALLHQAVYAGGSARLVQPFTGTNLTYQWYVGNTGDDTRPFGVSVDGIVVGGIYDTSKYWVKASNACDSRPSATFVVSVRQQITQQPVAAPDTIMPGQTTTLTAAGGTASATYAWYVGEQGDTSDALDAHSLTVTTPPVTATTKFWLRITSGDEHTDSDPVTVHLCDPPIVQWSAMNGSIASGTQFTLQLVPPAPGSVIDWYQGVSGDIAHSTHLYSTNVSYFQTTPLTQTTTYWARVTKGTCWSDSPTYSVNVCVPVIASNPASSMINGGASVTLSVAASPAALTYQWYTGAQGDTSHPISGATLASYTFSPSVTNSYWVRVAGTCGLSVDSTAATVTICQPPSIQSTAINGITGTSLSIAQGQAVTCSVIASGTNLTYQWYSGVNGNTSSPISGATAAQVTTSPQSAASYWVAITGTCGTFGGSTFTVSVCTTPVITTQPQSVTIFSGATATLSIAASEATSSAVTFQWYRGTSGDQSTPVGTGATFTTPALTSNTSYWVRASCGVCNPVNSQTATVSMCPIAANLPSPGDVSIALGQSATLATYSGAGNTYQWYFGASGNTSQTAPCASASCTFAPSVTTSYWCRVQNGTCVSSTPSGTISVCIPTITSHPQSIMINPSTSTTLTVAANTSGLTYQWYIGASGTTTSPIAGQTSSTLTISPSSATNYWVRVTGSCGQSVNSNTAAVTICQPPSISGPAPSQSIVRGQSTALLVTGSGTNMTYQWYIGPAGNVAGSVAIGTGTQSITVSPQDTTTYWARVTGTCGTANSTAGVVNVCASPVITSQPQSVSVFSGTTATLSVASSEATSTPVTYQWYRGSAGDTSAPAGTGASFVTPALTTPADYWVRLACGVCSPVDSQTATVSICPYPASLASPGTFNIALGQTAHLATVTGNSYTWYIGASGNTTQSFSVAPSIDVSPSTLTSYWCRVQNGTCVSSTATATVNPCVPTFTQHPASITIAPGSSTTLTSSANTAGVTYRWYTGATGNTASPVTNGTNATLTVTPGATTSYWVRATGSCGVTTDSTTATVTLCQPPAITAQPQNANGINAGYTTYLAVSATGSNLTYQWYYGDSGDTSSPVNGATGAAYSVPIYTTSKMWVRVSGQCGSVNSTMAWASVNPVITAQPQPSLTVGYNATATITIAVSGAYLHFAWKWDNGTPIAGAADSATLITPSITSYANLYCQVTSGAAIVTSYQTELRVCYDGPWINSLTKYPGYAYISAGNVYDYQWYQGARGDTSHPSQSGSPALVVSPPSATQYWCRVYSSSTGTGPTCYADSDVITMP